jgi:predicted site-specific integrase-resolvase
MIPGMDDDLIGTAEVTRILGVDKATVLRRIEAGKLTPAFKMPNKNGAYLFRRADVEALAAQRD